VDDGKSLVAGFVYRIAYSTKIESRTLAGVRAAFAPVAQSNGFQYTLFCFIFLTGKPVPTVGRSRLTPEGVDGLLKG
jgi:hypothetical protein